MKSIFLIALVIGMLTSCGNSKPKEYAKTEDMVMLAPPSAKMADDAIVDDDDSPDKTIVDTVKKIIKYGDISFETNNLNETRKKILKSLKKLGGYVAEDNETHDREDNQQQYVLKIRIPSKNFDLLLDSVSADAAKIDSKNISIRDVTSQFIDIKAQLANSRALENTYLGLLNKAGKMGEVLQIENKLTEIRTALDSTQGVLNYLSKQVAFSSLTVTFYTQEILPDNGDTIGSQFKTAVGNGWGLLQNLFFELVSLWPLILLFIFLYLLIRRWRRKRRQRK